MRREQGQAGIETLLTLPVLLLVALAGAETATWAASAVLVGSAAGAGARAFARGDPVDAAVRRELPGPFRGLAHVTVEAGVVRVVLRVPGAAGLDASAEAGP